MTDILGNEELALFCENMGMMFRAGISVDEALGLIAEDSQGNALGRAASEAQKEYRNKKNLSAALEATGSFPAHIVHMIDVGDQAGRLEQVFFSMAQIYSEQRRFDRLLRSALLYPMILTLLMTGVLLVLITLVLPVFSNVYSNMAATLGTGAEYGAIAQVVSYVALAIALVMAVFFLVATCIAYFGRSSGVTSNMLERLPVTRTTSYNTALSQAMNAMATFTASGFSAEQALEVVCPEVGNKRLRKKLDECLASVKKGEGFGRAAFDNNLLDPMYARMLVNGERSGNFDETFSYLVELIDEDSTEHFNTILSAIEPICAAFLSITVALALISIMVPLVGMMGAI